MWRPETSKYLESLPPFNYLFTLYKGRYTRPRVCSGVVPMGPAPPHNIFKRWKMVSDHSRTDALRSTMLQSRLSLSDRMEVLVMTVEAENAILWSQNDCRNLLEQCPAAVKLYRTVLTYCIPVTVTGIQCDSVAKYGFTYLKKLFHS